MKPSLRFALLVVLSGMAVYSASGSNEPVGATSRPNILVILTDDVGWGDFQCYNPQGKIPSPKTYREIRASPRSTARVSSGR